MTSEPIANYAMLSDCRSAALVSASGSVDWLCFPRFDSPSVFGRILGEDAGFWSIRPAAPDASTRRYLGPTMVLETVHAAVGGTVTVTDALVLGDGNRGHELGAGAPGTLLRQVACVDGEVEMEVTFAPRPEYGLVRPLLEDTAGGILVHGGADVLAFSTPVAFALDNGEARAKLVLRAGDVLGFALHHENPGPVSPAFWSQAEIGRRIEDTMEGWGSWSQLHQSYDGPWQDLVASSGRILQALTFYPTGAIVAAPTTSLPEVAGGTRNWDYRYTWIRDASMTLQALWVAACPDEAGKFFQFLATAAAGRLSGGDELQIMYGIGGERDLSERELAHLPGWRSSAPVRVGNGAWDQRQLDVYGEILDAAATLPEYLNDLEPGTRRFLADAADAAASRWQSTDQGIWEVRGTPRHYLHSKLMCWVAVDRAISLAGVLNAEERVPHWMQTRAQLADSIRTNGWNETAGAYTRAYGSEDLDASALMLSIVGFVAADDPRMLATIDAIEDRLTDRRGLVYRYQADDGLSGEEGTFLLCTFWLAHALALAGQTRRARAVFERAAGFATDLGLLAEEVAPDSSELLGNFPQAFSHIGLVNAAWAISTAEDEDRLPAAGGGETP
ncbi:glycoside hydrolase family 15 protein [Paenarthrobacter sp. PH39-S1]|uniref:glycoside hydrolase family 15 protein n=1 Tax=Micrococcaceae TaxID=1268 RepID=UPI0024BBAADF|nr:glycoside hydrolase family 15 protein [Paenarthrobacter sp. PH39-S1]MDJ0358268.1 glycoside hydrolase family 15 protein [Paenarthrobacter sp. PH39-S1]